MARPAPTPLLLLLLLALALCAAAAPARGGARTTSRRILRKCPGSFGNCDVGVPTPVSAPSRAAPRRFSAAAAAANPSPSPSPSPAAPPRETSSEGSGSVACHYPRPRYRGNLYTGDCHWCRGCIIREAALTPCLVACRNCLQQCP